MGFIDYHGKKEDRYTDVVEFAKSQQEEEKRRVSDEKAAKWISEFLGDSTFRELNVREIIKVIIREYRLLKDEYEQLLKGSDGTGINSECIWRDFCIYFITRHMGVFSLQNENKETTYTTFMSRIFSLEDFTTYNDHSFYMDSSKAYKQYFSECFDVFCEKYFWIWIKSISKEKNKAYESFLDTYKSLSVYMSYYLFQVFRSDDDDWMKWLEIEDKALRGTIKAISKQEVVNFDLSKLVNPIEAIKNSEKLEQLVVGDISGTEVIKNTTITEPNDVTEISKRGENEPVIDAVTNISVNAGENTSELGKEDTKSKKILDIQRLEEIIALRNLEDYSYACKMIVEFGTTERIDSLYGELKERIPVLREALDKFKDKYKDIYQPKMFQFYEYYFPEMIRITISYIEYADVDIGDKIKNEIEDSTVSAVERVLEAVNDIIDNIYRYASMDLKARSKALGSKMELDGHAFNGFKIDG